MKDARNKYSVIPAMLSADGEKGGAISAYNEALMERDKITKSTNSVNPLSEIADSQIDKLRDGVVLAIDNARKSSQFVLNDLKSQEKAIMSKMDYVPTYEREYLDYKRQQEILQGVYLILLQKYKPKNRLTREHHQNGKVQHRLYRYHPDFQHSPIRLRTFATVQKA